MANALHLESIRIVIAAAHTVVRAGIKYIFASHGHLIIVGEASATGEALSLAARTGPDIVLLDPDSDRLPLHTIGELNEAGASRLLVLTASTEARMHYRAFELGAVGVVRKDQPAETLVQAVERVHAGEIWLERGKTAELLVGLRRRDPDAARILSLTKREREVIALVGLGLKNPAIGERLFISEGTVRNHLTSILGKLELSDRFELAVYAFRHGLVEPETRRSFQPGSAWSGRSSRAVAERG
ncbi:MAG: response regulator [Luteitalea sp.]|nr:response regulator [Luteitalea sp.]